LRERLLVVCGVRNDPASIVVRPASVVVTSAAIVLTPAVIVADLGG
jgi:hypothetical protein